jgi:sulfatase maturation enzyme AslB (radical SAM superfamily)
LNCVHCISRETRKSVARLPEKFRGAITRWAREGKLKTAYTDFSGDIIWADQKFGGELDFLIGLSVPFHVDTNGTHLDATVADRLFASKVTSINVSIDAADDATYRRVRRGAPPLDTIFKNMEMLVHRRSAVNGSDVKLSAAFVLMRSNVAELPEFVRRVSAAGFDAVRAIHMQAYTDDVDEESLWWDKELFNVVRRRAIKLAKDLDIELYIDREFDDRDDRWVTCTAKRWRRFGMDQSTKISAAP